MSSLEKIDLDKLVASFENTFYIKEDEEEEEEIAYPGSPRQITIRHKKRKITCFFERDD